MLSLYILSSALLIVASNGQSSKTNADVQACSQNCTNTCSLNIPVPYRPQLVNCWTTYLGAMTTAMSTSNCSNVASLSGPNQACLAFPEALGAHPRSARHAGATLYKRGNHTARHKAHSVEHNSTTVNARVARGAVEIPAIPGHRPGPISPYQFQLQGITAGMHQMTTGAARPVRQASPELLESLENAKLCAFQCEKRCFHGCTVQPQPITVPDPRSCSDVQGAVAAEKALMKCILTAFDLTTPAPSVIPAGR